MLELLKKPNLSKEEQDRVRQLFKDAYFVYHQDIPLDRSEESLKYIMEMLGVEIDSSSLQSLSMKDAFTTNGLLEELNLGSVNLEPEISYIDMGSEAFKSANAYTESLTTGDDTLTKGYAPDVTEFYFKQLTT